MRYVYMSVSVCVRFECVRFESIIDDIERSAFKCGSCACGIGWMVEWCLSEEVKRGNIFLPLCLPTIEFCDITQNTRENLLRSLILILNCYLMWSYRRRYLKKKNLCKSLDNENIVQIAEKFYCCRSTCPAVGTRISLMSIGLCYCFKIGFALCCHF